MAAMTADSPAAISDRPARLAAIVLILLAGVMTGAQLGKIAPLIPWYGEALGLSMVESGWLAAILGLFIAVSALPAGWVIDRLGLQSSILLGATALIAGGIGLSYATSPVPIFAARLVEAVGYLALCVGLPTVLSAISPSSWKGSVLAIWSGFVPLGFAVSDFIALAMLPSFAPPLFLLSMTLLFALFAAAALLALRGIPVAASAGSTGGILPTLSREVLLLAAGFGAFVVMSVPMFTFMPAFVAGEGAHYFVSAGVIALSVPLGNFLASVLVRGRQASFMARLAVAGFLVCAVVAAPAFTSSDPLVATACALLLAISGAVIASSQFAAVPFLTPAGGSVSVAFGLVAQAGGIGTLFGPPVAAFMAERFGWAGFGVFLAATALVGLACMAGLSRGLRQPRH
ncbi:MFS transporter [Mesorhizobium sp. CAU 1741]|uniref:MFS transporter n=1 Tax=Mesorhizobium sp. CAU 1741 TaxID=3140366 RepID=UPI00325A81B0